MSIEFIVEGVPATSTTHNMIVVGFDGTPGSETAVEWAACEATRRGAALRVVTCWAVPSEVDFYGVGARQTDSLSTIVERTRQRHPLLTVHSSATHLDPRDALIDEATRAELLVVGSSTASAAKQLLFGSVARTAARRSPCPVVIVRGTSTGPLRKILVAIDGSSAAMSAVDWACEEADIHDAEIVLVHAWEADSSRADARRVLEAAVEDCRQRTAVSVRGDLVDGPPADAIIRASRDADLIAIGSRGRSGFKTALFGSVALAVADRAECPIAITHPQLRTRAE